MAALAAYSDSFRAGLVFDSQRVILADSRIQSDTPENVHEIWAGDYYNGTGSSALYRPLTTLTYLWNYVDFGNGANAAGYHAVNFALHALNIALVYLLGLIVFSETAPALALAALWALHPVLTESVTNVVGRADLLAALGILAGLLFYTRAAATTGWRSAAWICALAAASAIAIFSKESGVVLVGVMLAWDLAFAAKAGWRRRTAAYAAVLLPVAWYFAVRAHVLAEVSSLLIAYADNPLQGAGFLVSRLTAVKVLGKYLWLLFWPARLSADYSYNQIPLANFTDLGAIFALLACLGIAMAAFWSYRRARVVFFFIAFFAVTLAPVANLVLLVGSIMAERFLYLPSIAFAGCAVWAAFRYVRSRRVLAMAFGIIGLAYGVRTWVRNGDWVTERTLWESAVRVSADSYKTHENMATLLLAQPQADLAGATREVERALAILNPLPDDRSMPAVYVTAGQCYRERGDLAKALAVLERGRSIDAAWNSAFLLRNHRDGKTVNPVGTPPLYLELGRVYRDLGQPEKALEALRYGRSIDPEPAFFEEISRTFSGMKRPDQAAISLLEGVAVGAQPAVMAKELTQLYQETEPGSCALTGTAAAVTLNLACPMVHEQLCAASEHMTDLFLSMHDAASAAAIAQNAARNYGCAPAGAGQIHQ